LDKIKKYLQEFFEEDEFSIARLKGGVSRTSYLVSLTSGDRYVVHLGGSISFPRAEMLAEIQNSLANSGMQVPEVIHGPRWADRLGTHIEICTFIEGSHVQYFSGDDAEILGATVAELHAQGPKIQETAGHGLPRGHTKIIRSKAHLKHYLLGLSAYYFKPHDCPVGISFRGFLKGSFRWLKCRKHFTRLPQSYCHLDLNAGNILKLPERSETAEPRFAFLDFEKMEWEPCLLDMAIAICMSVGKGRQPGKFDLDNLHRFLAGYTSIRKLSATEQRLFPEILVETATHFQRIEILNWHRGNSETQIKAMLYHEDLKSKVSALDSIRRVERESQPKTVDGGDCSGIGAKDRTPSRKIWSFDVFNTLVARALASRVQIGGILALKVRQQFAKQLPDEVILNFEAIRNDAHARAHTLIDHPEIRLEEIYDAIAARYPEIDRRTLRRIRQLEEELEVELSYGIRENISQVLHLLDANERVIFISDTYLSEKNLYEIFQKVEPRLAVVPIYASSEIRLRKADGDLFNYVIEKEAVSPQDIEHFGDDPHTDYKMAKRAGIAAKLYRDSRFNEIENTYLNEKSGITGSVFASASLAARLRQSGKTRPSAYTLGASYTAPLFYGFIRNCLQRAAESGIRDIYFLARDGYILIEIAKRLLPIIAPEARLHYLYISRQSTLITSITKVTDRSIDWIFEEMDNVITLERVAHRLHCDCSELEALLPEGQRPPSSRKLRDKEIRELRGAILDNHAFRQRIETTAGEAREELAAYLGQSGIDGDSKIAIVDIGWKSTIQDCIYRALSSEKCKPQLEGYYFGCSHFSHLSSPGNQKHPYLITPSNLPGMGPFLELLLMAPHGTTIRYRRDESGKYQPELKAFNPTTSRWDMQAYFDGIIAFTESIIDAQTAHPEIELYPLAVDTMLMELLKDPPLILAEQLGDLPYCGDQEESNPRAMAPAFSFAEACKYRLAGRKTRSNMTQWSKASAKRSAFPARLVLACDLRKHLVVMLRDVVGADGERNKLQRLLKSLKF